MISILETGLSRSSIYSVDYVIFHSVEVAAKFHDILIQGSAVWYSNINWSGCWHVVEKAQTFSFIQYKHQIRRETVNFNRVRYGAEVGALASHLWDAGSIPKLNSSKNLREKSIYLPVRLIVVAINLTVALPCNTLLSVNRLVISSYLTNSYRKINTKARAALFFLFFICIFSGNPNCSPMSAFNKINAWTDSVLKHILI